MTTKHTPGPWYATGQHVQSATVNQDNYVCMAEGNTPEQGEYNAALISAAPELLAACQKALEMLQDPESDEYFDGNKLEILLRGAIDKARGANE